MVKVKKEEKSDAKNTRETARIDTFSTRIVARFQEYRTRKFSALGEKLAALHITPNFLTILSLLSGFIAVYFLFNNFQFFVLFALLHLFFDTLDGIVARAAGQTIFGTYFDLGVNSFITILLLCKTGWFLQEVYVYLITALFALTIFVHFISKLTAPIVLIRTGTVIVLILALIPGFWFMQELLIVGYLVAGIMAAYSLARQVQWLMVGK